MVHVPVCVLGWGGRRCVYIGACVSKEKYMYPHHWSVGRHRVYGTCVYAA